MYLQQDFRVITFSAYRVEDDDGSLFITPDGPPGSLTQPISRTPPKNTGLFREFARVQNCDQLLSFVETYGPLTYGTLNDCARSRQGRQREGDWVEDVLYRAWRLRDLVSLWDAIRSGEPETTGELLALDTIWTERLRKVAQSPESGPARPPGVSAGLWRHPSRPPWPRVGLPP
jgi:hypothetical protein